MGANQSPGQIDPKEAEERVSAAVADVVEDDGLLIEEDGDFFWLLQRIVWGLIKTLFIVGIIGAIIWFIWRSPGTENNEVIVSEIPITNVTESPKNQLSLWQRIFGGEETTEDAPLEQNNTTAPITPPPNDPITPKRPTPVNNLNTNTDDIYEAARWAYNLEYNRSSQSNSILGESIRWLKNAKTIGEISENYLRSQNPGERSTKIQEVITEGERLMQQYDFLNQALTQEYEVYLARGNAANSQVNQIDDQILNNIKNFQSIGIEDLLTEKITAQRVAAENLSQAKVRETLRKNMQHFATLLQQKMLPLFARPTELRSSDR